MSSDKQASRHQREIYQDEMGDWDFEGTDLTEGKRWVLRGACQSTRLRRYPTERDISAYVMWRAMRQSGHYVMGGLLGQQKVSYAWLLTADIEFSKQL
jgi:hypothetical protein